MPNANRISPEFGNALLDALKKTTSLASVDNAYETLDLILSATLRDAIKDTNILLSTRFTRIEYLCRELGYSPSQHQRLNATRNRLSHAKTLSETEKMAAIAEDTRCIARLIADLCSLQLPHKFAAFPAPARSTPPRRRILANTARMILSHWDAQFAYGRLDSGENATLRYNLANDFGSWGYLSTLFRKDMLLSLIHPTIAEDGTITASLIVCLPDLLINITTITGCMKPVGHSHFWYLLNLFTTSPSSMPILLGQFSGQLLDAQLHNTSTEPTNYNENVREFFQHNGLKILSLQNANALTDFHLKAKQQLCNINSIVSKQLPELQGYDLEKVVLEPTILCDSLGLQGRMDLLQSDFKVLIEQKSGKCDEWNSKHLPNGTLRHQEAHYAQFILYQAMIRYGLGIPNEKINGALLYSKYPNGLLLTGPAPKLLASCIAIRNRIASLDFRLAQGELEAIIARLKPEDFNAGSPNAKIWTHFCAPQVQTFLNTIRNASPIARAYFYRFATFICQEKLLARIGTPQRQLESFASIWCASQLEKQEAGSILDNLSIASLTPNETGRGAACVSFRIPTNLDDLCTNFRSGDIVIFYSYKKDTPPDATAGLLFRGSIEQISAQLITVRLRAPQRNISLFSDSLSIRWAIEHDHYENSEQKLLASIFSILNTPTDRSALLLTQRAPRCDTALSLSRDHMLPNGNTEFNTLALRAKQAQDFFLVVGPPGTGKTSYGLMCILREELASPDTNVLLLAFTNRAADEICSKLEKDGIDYLRVGATLGCGESYRERLLRKATKTCRNVADIQALISRTRVFTGTISALQSTPELLQLKRFSLAIVDEASQVIEPNLVGLFCAKHQDTLSIKRFVLIGDQRQLPAVVLQPPQLSRVENPALRAIGLLDCRESLFERLYRLYADHPDVVYQLSRQGRMHPDVASFPNRAFYGNRLLEVPLPHQTRALGLRSSSSSRLSAFLCNHRTLFFHVDTPDAPNRTSSGKSNTAEAQAVARIVLTFFDIYRQNHKNFSLAEQIGIIVPYRNQISTIRAALRTAAQDIIPDNDLNTLSIDTVERYQGSERDIIIFSLTVQHNFQLEFLAESRANIDHQLVDRKLNVALTRAREQIILVGNAKILQLDPLYAQLIKDYSQRDEVIPWSNCQDSLYL